MSAGTANPTTWPRCLGPLAYGQAGATRIFFDCWLDNGTGHDTSRSSAFPQPAPSEEEREHRTDARADRGGERNARHVFALPPRCGHTRGRGRVTFDRCRRSNALDDVGARECRPRVDIRHHDRGHGGRETVKRELRGQNEGSRHEWIGGERIRGRRWDGRRRVGHDRRHDRLRCRRSWRRCGNGDHSRRSDGVNGRS